MHKIPSLLLLVLTSAVAFGAAAKTAAGPHGGRLLDTAPQKAEFFVNQDGKVEIHFYDHALNPASPGTQSVAVTAEPKSGRTPLEMTKTATGFVSKTSLPEANEPYRVVVQVRASPEAKPQNFRIDLNRAICGECDRAEYACTCEGH